MVFFDNIRDNWPGIPHTITHWFSANTRCGYGDGVIRIRKFEEVLNSWPSVNHRPASQQGRIMSEIIQVEDSKYNINNINIMFSGGMTSVMFLNAKNAGLCGQSVRRERDPSYEFHISPCWLCKCEHSGQDNGASLIMQRSHWPMRANLDYFRPMTVLKSSL